jgi:ribonuclease HI
VFDVVVYCDGASRRNPGLGGWGSLIIQDNKDVFELGGFSSHATNNQMELTAVIKGLEHIESLGKKNIIILTDSSYVIHGIKDWVPSWKKSNWQTVLGTPVKNKDLWQSLDLVVTKIGRKHITWQHVPGHAGVLGNERVDTIASSFADKKPVKLYEGELSFYDVFPNPDLIIPDVNVVAKKSKKSSSKKKAYSYVSMVGKKIETHSTWPECLKRVNGVSGARFKKSFNKEDENSIISSWTSG